jgi:hypothetical protein
MYDARQKAYSRADREPAAAGRQVEVGVANGKTLPQACKEAEIVEQTYCKLFDNPFDFIRLTALLRQRRRSVEE